jgi:Asp-tRNA(Asn)/Glu-tRNA(Gln) amidotransferase A subunit family amidase
MGWTVGYRCRVSYFSRFYSIDHFLFILSLTEYKLDALISPDVHSQLTVMASAAGYPLISVPLGYRQSDSEPYGLLIAGTAWSEAILLRAAHGFEQASGVRDQRRPLYAERD